MELCNGNLGTQHDTPDKRPNSTASGFSLASSFNEDPIESDTQEPRKFNVDATCLGLPPRQVKDTQLAYEPGNAAVMQSPPRQEMDRTDRDPAASPNSTYRIPSRVFARTISTAPNEWSIASNESLFSIHPSNMSFTGDQYYKSGELGLSEELGLPGEFTIPGSLTDLGPSTPTNKSTDQVVQESGNLDAAHFGVIEAETMMEVIRENEEDPLKTKPASVKELPPTSANLGSYSIRSNNMMGSVKSFAFPILTGMDKSSSSRPGKVSMQPQSQPETPKAMPPHLKEEEVGLTQSKEPAPANATAALRNKMCCFSCC